MRMKQEGNGGVTGPGILQGQTVEILYENLRRYLGGDTFCTRWIGKKGIDLGW